MFKNMKVGTRLLAGFILVAVIGAVVAAIGIVNMQQMNAEAERSYTEDLRGLSLSKEANINLIYIGRAARSLVLVAPEQRPVQIKRIADTRAALADYLSQARPLYTSPAMKAKLAEIDQSLAGYAKEIDRLLVLANDDSPEGKAAATDHILKTMLVSANAADDQLTQLAKLKEDDAAAAAKASGEKFNRTRDVMIAMVIGSLVIGVACGLWITRDLTRQLGGEPAYATEVAGEIAAGNLANPIDVRSNDTSSLLYAMESMRQSLARIVTEVRSGTDTIATASSQIASGNLDLSSRTEEQASSLEETASSMEELTSTVRQNADNARQANVLANSASEVAARGGAVVGEVVDTMAAINESSRKIVDIISVIDGIAFQTNILALNAAVEAARAGEQGRGFAVVASEVRNLAQRSAGAAKEIKALITDSVEKVEAGGKLVDQAGSTMSEVVASITRVTDIMSEIAAATGEQTMGIEQVNSAIVQMDQVTQQNAALVEEASAAAEAMQDQASALLRLVDVFRTEQQSAAQRPAPAKLARASAPLKTAPERARLARPVAAQQDQWEAV